MCGQFSCRNSMLTKIAIICETTFRWTWCSLVKRVQKFSINVHRFHIACSCVIFTYIWLRYHCCKRICKRIDNLLFNTCQLGDPGQFSLMKECRKDSRLFEGVWKTRNSQKYSTNKLYFPHYTILSHKWPNMGWNGFFFGRACINFLATMERVIWQK